ncbi:transposase [Streptomyces sp. NPDC001698]|uniref:transposase n=1 Tax=Streptomyces sp. NPDC001698 TaxID=3364601 RepID=UPI0036928D89
MIRRAHASPLRFRWVTADAAYGQDSRFRRFLEDDLKLHYVVAVPKSQQVHGPRIEDRIRREAPPEAWRVFEVERCASSRALTWRHGV